VRPTVARALRPGELRQFSQSRGRCSCARPRRLPCG
jgi:hypothetical protein